MEKNKFLQEIRVLMLVVSSIIIGWFGCLKYQEYQTENISVKPSSENVSNNVRSTTTREQTNTANNTNTKKTEEPILYCPTITSTFNYEFKWKKDYGFAGSGNDALFLSGNFLNQSTYSNGFTLNSSVRASDSYKCEKGSKAGENINQLYCKTSFPPELLKKTTDSWGNITRTDKLYITAFVFDVEDKDLKDETELKSLKARYVTCSVSRYNYSE